MKAFNLIPKQESFLKASKFIKENSSLTYIVLLRLFIKKYSKKITSDKFAEIIVRLFDVIDSD